MQATITVRPSSAELPESVAAQIESVRADLLADLVSRVEETLVAATVSLVGEQAELIAVIETIEKDNSALIAKHEANQELSSVVADHKKQVVRLDQIARLRGSHDSLVEQQQSAIDRAIGAIKDRSDSLAEFEANFNSEERVLTDLKFGVETAVPTDIVDHVSVGFSQRSTNDYIKSKGEAVSYEEAQGDPAKFVEALRSGQVTLNKGYTPSTTAADVLTVTAEVRFSAELDTDRIGGFGRSSMTPGKQALFALTLILNESQEPWPLLIDQPEDDLDSRSIYDTIVPYLMQRKRERQIIMVSHNANLVIGADSELVIVANRHGADRKNKRGRTFEYFTGSLEHSQPLNDSSATALGRFGVREHACEILDGGEEAFQKRRNKYKI